MVPSIPRNHLAATASATLIATPLTDLVVRTNIKQRNRSDEIVTALTRQSALAAQTAKREVAARELQGRRQQFERRLTNASEWPRASPRSSR